MVAKNKISGDAEVIEQDIITDALKTVKAIVDKNNGVVDENSLAEADKIIRAKWWGDRPYIAKNAGEGSSERNNAIYRDYTIKGERICLLASRYGISRRQVERIIDSFKQKDTTSLS